MNCALFIVNVLVIGLGEAFRKPDSDDPLFLPRMAERLFREGGALHCALGLEHRPQQELMAIEVAQAFAAGSPLLFEAPTGVGKSLAYLLPGIVRAVSAGRQLLVSTHTKALQEQIRIKDLELCRSIFLNSEGLGQYGEFRAALLMGKGNYLCGTRLREALAGQAGLFASVEGQELERIRKWAAGSQTGLLHELTPPPLPEVWEQVNAESHACNNRNCTPDNCFYRRARASVEQAQVLIVNHSLLFALLAAGLTPGEDVPGILHANDFCVLDEAHTLPGVATDHLGVGVSDYALRRQLLRLYNPNTQKGLLVRHAEGRGLRVVDIALGTVQRFFALASDTLLKESDVVRLPHPEWAPTLLHEPLCELVSLLSSEAKRIGEGPARDELAGAALLLAHYNGGVNECLSMEQRDHVYWIERSPRSETVTLRSAPLDVAPSLRRLLFQRHTGIVLTSATLDYGDEMEGFAGRVGADAAQRGQVDSPFDFERNMRIYVAGDAPAPETGRLDLEWLSDMVGHCALAVRGGSLVLFTSYRDMRAVAAALEEKFAAAGRPFYLQGREGAPGHLRKRFADAGNAILFGTDSFWTGIDVPGPSLSQVIVTRLPFENPSHPVAEARSQWLAAQGDNPFLKLTVPEAVVKFRQGIGRLIRSRDDKGTLTLLDSRLLTREYGRRFLNVLPAKTWKRFTRSDKESSFKPLEA